MASSYTPQILHTETSTLHPDTNLGYVHLTVSDLARSLDYYQQALGFQVHQSENGTARLGTDDKDIVILTEHQGARRISRTTGLYHFAILVPSRLDLARSLQHLIDTKTPLTGASDHLVSEALYLNDPDGNGIEIYRDRPRSEWRFTGQSLQMGVDPLDYRGLLATLGDNETSWEGLPPGTTLGHMHLHVAHLPEAVAFYEQVVGLDVMMLLQGSAAFLSAGGYHHHLGLNTWNGVGVPTPPADAVGLRYFMVNLSDEQERFRLASRLKDAGVPYEEREDGLFVRDPSQNGILFAAE